MKFFQKSILLLLSVFVMSSSMAQTVYGTYDALTGQATVTANVATLTQKFKNELNDQGAQISNIAFITYDNGNRFILAAKVSNSANNVRAIGVEMVLGSGGTIVALRSGPGMKHSCSGDPCSNCEIKLKDFDVFCYCKDSLGKCNHTVEVVIEGW